MSSNFASARPVILTDPQAMAHARSLSIVFLFGILLCAKAVVVANETNGVLRGSCRLEDATILFEVTNVSLSISFPGNGTLLFSMHYGNEEDTLFIEDHIITYNTSSTTTRDDFETVATSTATRIIPACSFELGALGFIGSNDSLAARFHTFALWVSQALESLHQDVHSRSDALGDDLSLGACKDPYNKCNNKCYGMCGSGCKCWPQICGDCKCHGGCEDHDYYCSCKSVFHPKCISFTPFWERRCKCC